MNDALSKEYMGALVPSESSQFTPVSHYLQYLSLPVRNCNLQPFSGAVSWLSISLGVPPAPPHSSQEDSAGRQAC